MGYHRQFTIFILTYFLLCACLCSQPTRSRRQKRGIMKMMMHIMWDPVRLIRYWYAYDVTKEIAKSWRKILPTILLLPITQNMPHSHGLAKYVHPTVGVSDSNKKIRTKHPNIPVGIYYQGSAGNVKPVAIPSAALHQALPSRYTYGPPPASSIQYYSSRETENIPKHKHKSRPHVIVSHVPYEADKDDGGQYSIAHYFAEDDSSREETPSSGVFFPQNTDYDTEDDIRSSSTHHVTSNERKKIQSFNSLFQQSHKHYITQGSIRHEKGQEIPSILQTGQEVHIVLHPIPVKDFDPHSLQPHSDGQGMQFVPIYPRSNDSYGAHHATSPVLFKAVAQNSAESDKSHSVEDHATEIPLPTARNDWFSQNSDTVNALDEKSNEGDEHTKSRVTWIPRKCENESKETDQKESDLQPDETIRRTLSVHSNSPLYKFDKDTTSISAINRHNINIERLREDLKHGTPVLIPFNRNAYTSGDFSDQNIKNRITFPSDVNKRTNDEHKVEEDRSKEVLNVPIVNTSGEQSAEKNSTQKLILFLKKSKHG